MPNIDTLNAQHDIRAYDVLQVSRDGGRTWNDFSTLRTVTEAVRAMALVAGLATHDAAPEGQFRVARSGRGWTYLTQDDLVVRHT
jgi:hypothetical protein